MVHLAALKASIIANGDVPFVVTHVGNDVVIMARMSAEKFDEICAESAHFEDFEDNGDVEAVETTDGYSA
ncbi:hypothetical protein [Roseibium sp.]|uniref:hypothetical protein n=1 Tax=Roseibium sp. TaxID=1936156 RepID=UPI003B51F19D